MDESYKFSYEKSEKIRLDQFLTENLKISRNQISKIIHNKLCTVNGVHKKSSYLLNENDLIQIQIPKVDQNEGPQPENLNLDVVFEDDDLIVINKPFGMVVHPSHGHGTGTLVNALLHHCKVLSVGFHEHRPGIVHRLDKDTGGLIVAAKTHTALVHLAEQFKNKTAHRIYLALTYGKSKFESGTIENYLVRDPNNRKKFSSSRLALNGKFAKTHYKTIYSGNVSIFELKLETGRTHQIRVHLSEMGCPIINDPIYSTDRRINTVTDPRLKSKIEMQSNMFLFAKELSFSHPKTHEIMKFKAELPKSFKILIDYLDVQLPKDNF